MTDREALVLEYPTVPPYLCFSLSVLAIVVRQDSAEGGGALLSLKLLILPLLLPFLSFPPFACLPDLWELSVGPFVPFRVS